MHHVTAMDILKYFTLACFMVEINAQADIVKFLKSFVENEKKPTMVVFHGVCWKNSFKVDLMKELSEAGVRSAPAFSGGTSFLDHTVLLLADLDCPQFEEVLKNATHRELNRLPYRWLVVSSAPVHHSPLWDSFLVDSDLVLAVAEERGYRMTEIHKPGPNISTILTPRGEFNGVLTDVRPHRELFRRRQDIMGAPITMTNIIQDSKTSEYHLLQEDRLELQYDLFSKNGYSLARVGSHMLNATLRSRFTNRFGYVVNGQWTGIVRDLIDYTADIGTNIGMNQARREMVAFADAVDNGRLRFVFRQPALSLTDNIFSLPFSSGVWLATVVSCCIGAAAFSLSRRIRSREDGSVSDAILMTMGAISQQGCEVEPKNVSTRVILWVLLMCLTSLYAAYSANIVVLLQAPSSSVTNLQQLAKSKLKLAAVDVDYNYFLFKGNLDPVRNEISKKVDPDHGPKEFYQLDDGVERIRKGLFALHSGVEPVYRQVEKTFKEKEKCDLVEIDYVGYPPFHTPVSRKSPYLELFRVVFKRIREAGIKSAVNFRYEARKPPCKDSSAMFSSVGATELRPVLLVMVYGVLLSLAVFAGEHFVFHVNRNRRLQRRLAERFFARRSF